MTDRDRETDNTQASNGFDSGGLAPVVGQMLFLPLTMMMYGLNLLARTARTIPSIETAPMRGTAQPPRTGSPDAGRDPPPIAAPSGWAQLPPDWRQPPLEMVRSESSSEVPRYEPAEPVQTQQSRNVGSHEPQGREEQRRMVDNKSLQDDMLKTVRYWVSFEKRGYETVLFQDIDQVYDNLSDAQFTAWKMAEFMDKLEAGDIKMPHGATGTKSSSFTVHKDHPRRLGDIESDDKRYLALDWEVIGRVQRRRGWFDERKTEALEEIAESVKSQKTLNIVLSKP